MRHLLLRKSLGIWKASTAKPRSKVSGRGLQLVKGFAILIVLIACSRLAIAQSDSGLPSVDVVLDHFVQALGGHAALENITSMTFTGALTIPALKTTGRTTEYFKSPNYFAFIAELPGYGTVRTVYDGKTAWNADPKSGVTEISGPQLSDIRRRADINWNLKLKEFYPGLKVAGREQVKGKDAWALEATVEGWTYRLYFDSATGLLVRFDTDTHQPDGVSSVLIGDYRDIGKVRFAFAASMTSSKGGWSRQLDDVKFNVPIEDSVFAKPSSPASSGNAASGKPPR
jgi:outer membrane lipoprotein-sorting protein